MSALRTLTANDVGEINALELRIAAGEADLDAMLWEQAEHVVAQLDSGLSQRKLAAQWINVRTGEPYSQMHVLFTARVYREKCTFQPRPHFRDAYNAIANAKPPSDPPAPEPFHWLNAVGDLRRNVERMVEAWPVEARPLVPEALRALATILEREWST